MNNDEVVTLTLPKEDFSILLAGMQALKIMINDGIISYPDELLEEEDFETEDAVERQVERVAKMLSGIVKPKPKIGF
jgi:hypothetical protein